MKEINGYYFGVKKDKEKISLKLQSQIQMTISSDITFKEVMDGFYGF